MRRWWLALVCLVAACSDPDPGDEPPPTRAVVLEGSVGAGGLSEDLAFTIPDGTRALTIVVEGAPAGLYALGGLAQGDAVDRVALPAGDPGAVMRAAYHDEQIGQMPGALFQSIRLGTFTHVYPYRPGQVVVPGAARLRVASDTPGPVRVTVLMPPDDGAATLVLNLIVVSDSLLDPSVEPMLAELQRLYGQVGIGVRIGGVERITGTALERITQSTEPQEAPDSQAAMLPALVAGRAREGLDIFLVETLPAGIAGLALGTPGPPVRGSYYFGVIVRGGLPHPQLAQVIAHEAGHFLALQHVRNVGVSGMTYDDPLDDTVPGADNLMEDGTTLTADQGFALRQSALLVP